MVKDDTKFSKLRSFFWPIHRHELVRFVPMLLLFFFISFNYHILRVVKDTIIVTAPHSGAEVIPFLKVWVMLPTTLLFTFLFTHLANHLNREKLFYCIVGGFLLFFTAFILVLYPVRETLYLNSLADFLTQVLPAGCKGFIALLRYWMYSLFYVMAESWSNIVLSVLLWGFANEVTSFQEARRFYALFGIGINSSGILAGKMGTYLSSFMEDSAPPIGSWMAYLGEKTSWDQTFTYFIVSIILCGLITLLLYRWLHVKVFTDHRAQSPSSTIPHASKPKMSLWNNITYVAKSPYLLHIAIIVLSYNIIINLTEVLWKSQMKELFPNAREYAEYMSQVTFFVGIVSTFSSYFLSGNIIRTFGWKAAALITPMIVLITGIGFFYCVGEKEYRSSWFPLLAFLQMSPLALAVFFGSLQNCLTRSAKYTVFDDTKEMAFIPLTSSDKLKGKSAIDGLGSRLGKSGSSLIMQILLISFSTIEGSFPFLFAIILCILPIWMGSIRTLNKKFGEELQKKPIPTPITEEKQPALAISSSEAP